MVISFYCKKCGDQDREAVKDRTLWGDEYFWAPCVKCRKKLVRYITERQVDPYYRESPKMRHERYKHRTDLIQPGQPNFGLWYKEQWKQMEQASEEYEKKQQAEKEKAEQEYKKHKHDPVRRKILKKLNTQWL